MNAITAQTINSESFSLPRVHRKGHVLRLQRTSVKTVGPCVALELLVLHWSAWLVLFSHAILSQFS